MTGGHPGDTFNHQLCEELSTRFNINCTTVQIEIDQQLAGVLTPENVV